MHFLRGSTTEHLTLFFKITSLSFSFSFLPFFPFSTFPLLSFHFPPFAHQPNPYQCVHQRTTQSITYARLWGRGIARQRTRQTRLSACIEEQRKIYMHAWKGLDMSNILRGRSGNFGLREWDMLWVSEAGLVSFILFLTRPDPTGLDMSLPEGPTLPSCPSQAV